MVRIVAAFDSFKSSLTSREAGEAFRRGVMEALPTAEVRVVAIADGGEGMAEAVHDNVGGRMVSATVHDPIGRAIEASYLIIDGDTDGDTTAVIAMSAASGLGLIEPQERNPLVASTFGTGELILDAARRGCKHIVVGLGGSATNDGGAGMLRALGYRFYDADNGLLTTTIDILERIARISTEARSALLDGIRLTAAVDVDNPLYGPQGAAYIFARQKGADDATIERLDCALRHYAEVIDTEGAAQAGAGAAGGVGYAFSSVLQAELRSGIDMVLGLCDFDSIVRDADIVATGEGALDGQTLHGKAPMGVLRAASAHGVAVIALAGRVSDREALLAAGFSHVAAITPPDQPLSEAIKRERATENMISAARNTFTTR